MDAFLTNEQDLLVIINRLLNQALLITWVRSFFPEPTLEVGKKFSTHEALVSLFKFLLASKTGI